jgi:hypothetical protein
MRRVPAFLIVCWLGACAPRAITAPPLTVRAPAPTAASPASAEEEEVAPFERSPRDLHWGRTFAEAGALFGILETKYWIDKDANSFDFQYDVNLHNLKERFITFRAWSLDDNFFNTNGWHHTAQGGLNYLFARSNGFSSIESYVFSLGLSAAWEFFGEFKEEVSVNDLVVTPRSGAVVGEAVWQLGVFFLRGDANWFNRIAGNTLTLGRGLLDRHDGKPLFHSARTSSLGFDATVNHRFALFVLGGQREEAGQSEGIARLGLDTELLLIPGFDRPQRGKELRIAPSFTQIHVEATRTDQTFVDFRAFARAAVTMWHRKDIRDDGNGWNLLYGLSSAYEYGFHASKDFDDKRTHDRVAIAHLLGPTFDLTLYRYGLVARMITDVYADFGLLRSHAIDAHLALFPDEEVRSTIVRDNYYHALGLTGRVRAQVAYGPVAGGLAYQRDHFKSVQGIDRHQADLVDDYALYDERAEGRLWARYGFSLSSDLSLEIELAAELRDRSGHVKTTERSDQEHRYLGGVQLAF